MTRSAASFMPARDIVVPLLLTAVLVATAIAWVHWNRHASTTAGTPRRPLQLDTAHYTILSNASSEQTQRVARAVESLHAAYANVFAGTLPAVDPQPRMQLVLYRDRREFKANNRSSPWAEAFYKAPRCHAYYAEGSPNPYHWMVHEATHQLNHERAHFRTSKWVSEGLASYFGTSRIEVGQLRPGEIDPDTYPTWWLPQLALSGDLDQDLRQGRLIPLRALITDTGPDINLHVNLYYIQYWSLTHFLFEHDNGRHAERFKALVAAGGSLPDVERLFGPIEPLQREWYAHLLQMRARLLAGQSVAAKR